MAAAPIYPGALKTVLASLTTVNTTAAFSDVWTPSTAVGGGGTLESLCVTQDSTTASRGLTWGISTGGATYIIGESIVSSGAGTDGATPPKDVLNPGDLPFLRSDGVNRYFRLAPGYKLQVRPRTAMDAGKTLYITGQAGDY